MNTKDIYNLNKDSIPNNNNFSTLQNNLNKNIHDNDLLYRSNSYNETHLNLKNDISTVNSTHNSELYNYQNSMSSLHTTHENELMYNTNNINENNVSIPIPLNNSNNFENITTNNESQTFINNNEKKIIEVTKKIPLIRLYVFVKQFKAKCVFKILYQISYILNLFDLNKRRNFINSIPLKLPKILENLLLINFPIKLIESIIPNYKNYHIPTTQEIIAPFLELIISLTSIPANVSELSYDTNENSNQSDNGENKSEKDTSSKCSMSPLLLPQSELPCKNSPESVRIIQTPSTFLYNNDEDCHSNLESNQNFDTEKFNYSIKEDNLNYIDEIIDSTSIESNPSNSYRLSKQHRQLHIQIPTPTTPPIPCNRNDMNLEMMNSMSNKEFIPNNENGETPYNFLANNMKIQSNLTLFPLSPYITLNNSDFETDIKPETIPNNTTADNASPSKASFSSTPKQKTTSPIAATLSTVAASIAALKSSSTSSKHNESSLSKVEKRNLSMIKNSNIVKNIVKSFEEINSFYKNSLLETTEKTNTTKSAKGNGKKFDNDLSEDNNSDDNNENENNKQNEVIEEKKENQPEEDIKEKELEEEEEENIDENTALTAKDKMKINEACDKVILESRFIQESDFDDIEESTKLLNSYIYDNNNGNILINDGMTEIIKDFSLENTFSENSDDDESNSEISNAIFNSLTNVEDLDIARLTILLIENFVKLSDVEKEEFLNSEYFELIKNHVMNIQNDNEIEFSSIFKDPKMLNEFESHIEALQQCVKERDDIINYYYQEIVNERIQNEKLLIFCENEQLEREETNKIISGLTKKIEMEEDYIKKLEVRCDMLIEKIKKYQSCCKHYEKSISLLSSNKSNSLKLINSQNFETSHSPNPFLANPPSFVPSAAAITAATGVSSSTTSTPIHNDSGRPTIAHLINKLSCEKISKNEEIQYLKSLLKSYNGKHIYLNENVIKKQIIEKTQPSSSQSIPATVNEVPVIPVSTGKDLTGKQMMMEKYFNDEKQLAKMEETLIVSDGEDHEESDEIEEEEDIIKNSKSIDLSIIDDLNIFNEKHYQERILNKHQGYGKPLEKDMTEEDNFSEYAPTLVN